jgi:hypothetical protein
LVFTMCSGRPVVGFSLLKREIDTAAAAVAAEIGVAPPAPWTLHGIRRSEDPVERDRRARRGEGTALAHAIGGAVRQTYDHYGYAAELRTLFEQWESRLAVLTGANVVTLPLRPAGRR